eukprot:6204132-Pleurochrysis_carterae.AAC.2
MSQELRCGETRSRRRAVQRAAHREHDVSVSVGGGVHRDRHGARRLAEERHVARVAAKRVHVALDPLERQLLVPETQVAHQTVLAAREGSQQHNGESASGCQKETGRNNAAKQS